ncbi:MAG: diadenylate cyclase CdaA [Planctomycetota bacterium]|nr:diadenylate cyclase CdaA [Planctomycetota bacterium]
MHLGFILKDLIDVLLLGYILYRGILLFAETRAIRLAYGIGILIVIYFLAREFNLSGLVGLFTRVDIFGIGAVVLAILFAPEIREALARIGTGARARFRQQREEERKVIEEVVRACYALSEKKVGALIVLQRDDALEDYIRSGVPLDSQVSAPLLESIFPTSSPLHDGAVVIKGGRLIAAKCILPLSQSIELKREGVGTRHRAGLGITEERDAAVLIVSEERGSVSLADSGKMLKFPDEKQLQSELMALFVARMKRVQRRERFRLSKAIYSNFHWKVSALVLALGIWAFQVQDLDVTAAISFHESDYPSALKDLKDGSTVVLDPQEMRNRALTIRGKNFRLYQILFGILSESTYLDGYVRVDSPPRKNDHDPHRELGLRHHGDTSMPQWVILDEGVHRKDCPICENRSKANPGAKPITLHVGTVAVIPKTSVGVWVNVGSGLPAGYKSQRPVIEFKKPDDPLVCLEKDREILQTQIATCRTNPEIVIEKLKEDYQISYAREGVTLVLPEPMRRIALNQGGNLIKSILIPIGFGGPPPIVAEAERIRGEVEGLANVRVSHVKDEVKEIEQQETVDTAQFLKTLDLPRLDRARKNLETCRKDIEDARTRLAKIQGEIADEAGEHAELLRGIRDQSARHLQRYIDSTTEWQDKTVQWIGKLEGHLAPVIDARNTLVRREESVQEEREKLGRLTQAANAPRLDERYLDLSAALKTRREAILGLEQDPLLRLEGIAALFPSEDHAVPWRELERGLGDKAAKARQIQVAIQRVEEREKENDGAPFPALADYNLQLAKKQRELRETELASIEKEIVLAEVMYERVVLSLPDEHSLLDQRLKGLSSSLEEEPPASKDARKRLANLIEERLVPAVDQAKEARDQTREKIVDLRADLSESDPPLRVGDPPDEPPGELELALEKFRESEKSAKVILKDFLRERVDHLAKRIELLEQAKALAEGQQKKIPSAPASSGESSPPRDAGRASPG